MGTNKHSISKASRGAASAARRGRMRTVALVLSVLMAIVLAAPGSAFADDPSLDELAAMTAGGEAAPAEAAPAEAAASEAAPAEAAASEAAPAEAAASEDSPPTTAAPETTPGTVPAGESHLRPTGDIGVLAADDVLEPAPLAAEPITATGATITKRDGVEGCMGVRTTPGSENTLKEVVSGSFEPNTDVVFRISYPKDPEDDIGRTTFQILDCVFIGNVPIESFDISFVPNTADFSFLYTLRIPSDAPNGATYCNYAKTTATTSKASQSNRKAQACFIIGGAVRVLKVDVSGASLAGATFSVVCVPPTVKEGTYLSPIVIEGAQRIDNTYTGVIADGVITISGPQGTVCTVTETMPPQGYQLADPATQTATIGSTQVVLTFINERATGSLVINKVTTGGTGTFTFRVDCSDNAFDQTVTVVNSGSQTITGIPTGTICSVTEDAAGGFTSSVTTGASPVTIGSGNNTIGFTNVRNTGNLVINKTTTGGTGTFTFRVDCSDNAFDQTVTIVDSGSRTITGIPTGTTCSVTEDAAPGWTSSVTTGASPVTIGSGNNTIGFTNSRNTGNLVINKTTTGGTGTFTFRVDCSDNAFDQTVTIVNSGSRTITGIPTGTTCSVVETLDPEFDSAITTGSSPLTIATGSNVIGFTNTAKLPSLGIQKTPDAASVSAGSPIGFTVSVSNAGPGTARNAVLTDPLPPAVGVTWSISPAYAGPGTCAISGTAPTQVLSCSFGNLAPGAGASVHVASATTSATSGTLVNTATVRAENNPPVDATASIVVNRPGLAVTKVADQSPVNSGSQIGFTVTVSNAGPGTATGVTLSDPLPAASGVTWSISPARAGCAITGTVPTQVLNCTFGDMAPGASASVHVVSPTTAATSGTLTNTATAQATNHPPVTAIANIVVNKPSLTVTKTADAASVTAGNNIGFTVRVANAGPGAAINTTVSDPLPGGVDVFWTISPATAGCSITGTAPQTLSCTVANLAPGASLSVHVVSTTTVNSVGTFNNVATARADNHAAVTANATLNVIAPPVVQGVVIERAAPAILEIAPVVAPAPAAVVAVAEATLPRTGSDPWRMLFAAALLILTGARLRRWSRRTA